MFLQKIKTYILSCLSCCEKPESLKKKNDDQEEEETKPFLSDDVIIEFEANNFNESDTDLDFILV